MSFEARYQLGCRLLTSPFDIRPIEAQRRKGFREQIVDPEAINVEGVRIEIGTTHPLVRDLVGVFYQLDDNARVEPSPAPGCRSQAVFHPALDSKSAVSFYLTLFFLTNLRCFLCMCK